MSAWADNAGLEKFFQGECIYDALKGGNPFLRLELFNWFAIRLPEGKKLKMVMPFCEFMRIVFAVPVKSINKDELSICVPILLASVEDRNPDVRKSAQEVIPAFMMHLGYEAMSRAAAKLKVRKTIKQCF